MHETELENPFTLVFANLSNVPRKMSKHMVLCHATRSSTLLFPVPSPLLYHISESVRYVSSCKPKAAEESPPNPVKTTSPNPREKLLKKSATSRKGPGASVQYAVIYGKEKVADSLKDLIEMFDLSDIDDD